MVIKSESDFIGWIFSLHHPRSEQRSLYEKWKWLVIKSKSDFIGWIPSLHHPRSEQRSLPAGWEKEWEWFVEKKVILLKELFPSITLITTAFIWKVKVIGNKKWKWFHRLNSAPPLPKVWAQVIFFTWGLMHYMVLMRQCIVPMRHIVPMRQVIN